MTQDEEERAAKSYALKVLSRRALLSSELEDKLLARGVSSHVVESILSFFQQKGYLNDQARTEQLIVKARKQGKSNKAIFYKLKAKKGVDLSLLKQLLTADTETEALHKQLRKYAKRENLQDFRSKQKVIGCLYRQGFSLDAITQAMEANS